MKANRALAFILALFPFVKAAFHARVVSTTG